MLSPQQLTSFSNDGFVVVDSIAPAAEVALLRTIFDRLFSEKAGWAKGAQFDLAGTDEPDRPAGLPQILNPVEFAPELRKTQFRANALAVAKQLLGPDAEPWFEHAILKPPRYGSPTPWHQDEAHRDDAGTRYQQISIWMPLQDATVANGCMSYVPGSHRGPVLDHWSPNNNPKITALECIGPFNAKHAVPCPTPAGGAAIHHSRTLHAAGPNQSDAPRLAYVLAFRGPITADPTFQGYPWNIAKRTAAQERKHSWEEQERETAKTEHRFLSRIVRKIRRLPHRLGERFLARR